MRTFIGKETWNLAAIALGFAFTTQAAQRPAAPAPAKETKQNQTSKSGKSNAKDAFGDSIRAGMEQTLSDLNADNDFSAAKRKLDALFDQVTAFGEDKDLGLFRDIAAVRRLVGLINQIEKSSQPAMLECCVTNPNLGRALAFAVKPDQEKVPEVFAVLARLQAQRPRLLNTFATLATAICIVHDKPLRRMINENGVHAADPIAIFDYFVANEGRMYYHLQDVPAELLIYIVDSTASIEEMNWALQKYAGNRNIGRLFFDIKYDYDHLQGAPKKVTQAGFNLANILRFGGVCADQTYFAVTVGKSIGVPAAFTQGASGQVGHAWVGFLESDGRNAWWNFNSGRYEAYQGIRGNVEDPQIRKMIPDSYVSLLADFIAVKELNRQAAAALTDAAQRLIDAQSAKTNTPFDPVLAEGLKSNTHRQARISDALSLLESAVDSCPGYAAAWLTVRDLAADGKLSFKDKVTWAEYLHRLCSQRYPDFYFAIIGPMIETVNDVKQQNSFWEAAFNAFQARMDLSAAVRMEQAEMWLKHDEKVKAGLCYEDVINRYANAGPFVIAALTKEEKLLREIGQGDSVLVLYQHAWSQMKKPKDMAGMFMMQSNWFRVGSMYAERLGKAGLEREAGKVKAALAGN